MNEPTNYPGVYRFGGGFGGPASKRGGGAG
jgi:hypothetical protein